MEHSKALTIAEWVLAQLAPHCSRIEIGGSIRRKKADVKDVEIICIAHPYEDAGLFVTGIAEVYNQWEDVKTGYRYTQRILPGGMKLDLFFANELNWGWIYALRTGSSDFNFKYLEAIRNVRLFNKDGHIVDGKGEIVPVREEVDFFNLIRMPFVLPQDRI